MSPEQHTLTELVARYAYRHHPEGITLASGRKSEHYFNGKEVLCRREGGIAFARWALSVAREFKVSAVGGLELGAVPPASMMSALSPEEAPLDCFIVRKKPKDHGLKNLIEGILPKGARVAVIEDVVTTGSSALAAIEAIEAAGARVEVILALLDRQEGTLDALSRYPLRAALTLSSFLAARTL
jgi:orotate phosphoribosyltransferase